MPRSTPPSLQALGGKPLPTSLTLGGHTYYHRKTFKNDFFAVTSLYEGKGGQGGPEGGAAGALSAAAAQVGGAYSWRGREEWFLRQLDDLDGVPEFLGRWGDTGIVRHYLDGHPLQEGGAG